MRLLALSWTALAPPRGGASVRGQRVLSLMPDLEPFLVAPSALPPGIRGTPLHASGRPLTWFNRDVLRSVSPAARRTTLDAWREVRPDVVLALGLWAMGMARLLRGRVPIVLDLAHVESVTARESGRPAALWGLVRRLERNAVRRADQVWTVSAEDRERVVRLSGVPRERIMLVPNGVDGLPAPLPATSGEPFRVLFVGRGSFRPNREAARFLVCEVRPLLDRDVLLTVVGGARVPARPGVELVGECDELAPQYARAAVVCAPIFAGTGTRLKVLEAAAHGRPLVATPRAVEGLGMVPGTHYLEADTPQRFADAIRSLRQDPERAASLARSAREHALARFRWEEIAACARQHLGALVSLSPPGSG